MAFRKTLYTSIDQIQADLDAYMNDYNTKRTNQGKRCQGRTPKQTWDDGYRLYEKYVINETSINFEKIDEDRPSPPNDILPTNYLEDEAATIQNFQSLKSEATMTT